MDDVARNAAGVPARRMAVAPDQAGWRLDRLAALLWPGLGLRGRRRCLEAGRVTVNGRVRGPAHKVRAGDVVESAPGEPAGTGDGAVIPASAIPVLEAGPDYAMVVKPGGLHTASLGPAGGHSLEALLPGIFPGRSARLLSRLDYLTSGLVPVAFSAAAAEAWRRLEDAGGLEKTYLAVVHGMVAGPFVATRELDVRDRATTRVLPRDDADPLRHTAVAPVRTAAGLTLVRCRIAKGARHQIRAHLAAAGHPLVGDPRYGRGEGGRLFLHAAALACGILAGSSAPPWSLEDAVVAVEEG